MGTLIKWEGAMSPGGWSNYAIASSLRKRGDEYLYFCCGNINRTYGDTLWKIKKSSIKLLIEKNS